MEKKTTVGAEAVKRLANPDTKQGIVDTGREINKDYFVEVEKCVNSHKEWTDPFFVVIHYKKERLMNNVVRRYFFARRSLPTPQWGQDVWKYDPKTSDLTYLWTLPDEQTAMWMYSHPDQVDKEMQQLLVFVHDFLEGRLYAKYHKEFEQGDRIEAPQDSSQLISR